MNDGGSTCSIAFSFLLRLLEVGNVLKDFLVDELDLLTGESRDYLSEVFDGFRLNSIIF